MNLTDLPDLMRERYETDDVLVLTESRIDGIGRKVAATRRRRAAGALAGVAAIAAVAVVALPHIGPHQRSGHATARPVITATPVTIDGFPQWAEGGRLVASDTAALDAGPIRFIVTPDSLNLRFADRCTTADPTVSIFVAWTVNNHSIGGATCNGSFVPDTAGLEVGTPATVTVTVVRAEHTIVDGSGSGTTTEIAVPPGTISVAARQQVPFDEYPLPARPDPLPALDLAALGAGNPSVHLMVSDPLNPLEPQTYTVTWPEVASDVTSMTFVISSQTPGLLHVTVDGATIATAEFWDYYSPSNKDGMLGSVNATRLAGLGVHVKPGAAVTITVIPEYVTGTWAVGVHDTLR